MLLLVMLALVSPVPGELTRGFDPGRPFEGGRHRGVDLAAAPGAPVRAACSGPVAFAGRIGSAGIVTLRCGPWRVTHMPLATIAAHGHVERGAVIGTVAASRGHDDLHLGVRREGTRFGYVDPLRFLARRSPPLGPAPRPGRRAPPRGPAAPAERRVQLRGRATPAGRRAPALGPATPAARRAPSPWIARPPQPASLPFAPWPAWAGLALVLAGAGLRLRVRPAQRIRTRRVRRRAVA